MTELPAAPSSRRAEAIAWTVIWLISGYLLLSHLPIGPQKPGETKDEYDVRFEMTARGYIGAHKIDPRLGAAMGSPTKQANTPMQKLHMAIAEGEVAGAEAAMKLLDELDARDISDELRQDIDHVHRIYTFGSPSLEPDQRERLLARHQFFARLALSFQQPDTDPARAELLRHCRRTAVALLIAGAVILGLGLAGLVLFIVALVLYFDGRIVPAYVPQPHASSVYIEMFAVYLVAFVAVSMVIPLIAKERLPLAWQWAATIVVPIALGWGVLRGARWDEIRRGIGWHGGQGVIKEIALGIVGYIASLPVLVAGFLVTWALIAFSRAEVSHPVQNVPLDSVAQALLLYSIASLWAPFVEETMFRGALFHHMRRRWGWLISAVMVAFIFAAIHPQGWTTIPALGAIAVVLAGLREWRGSILAPMAAHAFSNGMIITLLVALK